VLRQADLRMYLFWGGKGMFLCFYVKKFVPVDMALQGTGINWSLPNLARSLILHY
jgi:hypothetical protein